MIGFMVQEAIASVSMEHPKDCTCLICRAASGDQAAFDAVFAAVAARELS